MPKQKIKKQFNRETVISKNGTLHILNASEKNTITHKTSRKPKKSQSNILNGQTQHINSSQTKFSTDSVLDKKFCSAKPNQKIVLRSPLTDVGSLNNASYSPSKSFFNHPRFVKSPRKEIPQKLCIESNNKIIKQNGKGITNLKLFDNTGLSEPNLKGAEDTSNDNLSPSENGDEFSFFKNKFKQASRINKSRVCGVSNDVEMIFQFPQKQALCNNQENVVIASPTCKLSSEVTNMNLKDVDTSPISMKRKLPFVLPTVNLKKNKVISKSTAQAGTKISQLPSKPGNSHNNEVLDLVKDVNLSTNISEYPAHNSTEASPISKINKSNDNDNNNFNKLQDSHSPVLDSSYHFNAINSKNNVKHLSTSSGSFSKRINSYKDVGFSVNHERNSTIISHCPLTYADPIDNSKKVLSTSECKYMEEFRSTNFQESYSPVLDSCHYKTFSCKKAIETPPMTPNGQKEKTGELLTSPVLDSSQYKKFSGRIQNCNTGKKSIQNCSTVSQEQENCYDLHSPILCFTYNEIPNHSNDQTDKRNSHCNLSSKSKYNKVKETTGVNEENKIFQLMKNNNPYTLGYCIFDNLPLSKSQSMSDLLSPVLDSCQYKFQTLDKLDNQEMSRKENNGLNMLTEKLLHQEIESPVLESRQHKNTTPVKLKKQESPENDFRCFVQHTKPYENTSNKSHNSGESTNCRNYCRKNCVLLVNEEGKDPNQELAEAHLPLTPISPVLDLNHYNKSYSVHSMQKVQKAHSSSNILQKEFGLSQNLSVQFSPSPILDSSQFQFKKLGSYTTKNISNLDDKEANELKMSQLKPSHKIMNKSPTSRESSVSPVLGSNQNKTIFQDSEAIQNKNTFALSYQQKSDNVPPKLLKENIQQYVMLEEINAIRNTNKSLLLSELAEERCVSSYDSIGTISPILNCSDSGSKFCKELQNTDTVKQTNSIQKLSRSKQIDDTEASILDSSACERFSVYTTECLSPVLDCSQLKYKNVSIKSSELGNKITGRLKETLTKTNNLSYSYPSADIFHSSPVLSEQQLNSTHHKNLPVPYSKASNSSFQRKSIENVEQNGTSSPTLMQNVDKEMLPLFSDLSRVKTDFKSKSDDIGLNLGPMLSSGIKIGENKSCSPEFNVHINIGCEEKKIPSPSFDSELDIRQFPISFPEEAEQEHLLQNLNFVSHVQSQLPSTNLKSLKEDKLIVSTKIIKSALRENAVDTLKCDQESVSFLEGNKTKMNKSILKTYENETIQGQESASCDNKEVKSYNQPKTSLNQRNHMQQELSAWKNGETSFECEQVLIEDYDDESLCNSEDFDTSIDLKKLNSVKRNLTESFQLDNTSNTKEGALLNSVGNEEFNLEFVSQDVSLCDSILSGKSICEADIQEELTQESTCTKTIQIECSSSPQTKSLQETQTEEISGTQSFPPPLNIPDNTLGLLNVLDSARKTRRSKLKKGSLVERLHRLVRAESAEVNMFQHEGVPGMSSRACSLVVKCVSMSCSRLLIRCHYSDSHPSCSDEFSSGEEVLDPEVRVFIDPRFAKNIVSGSRVLIYPPWHSLWLDGRGIMLMYGVTKIQVAGTAQLPPPTNLSVPTETMQYQYNCQTQDEVCDCRQQLMSQICGQTQTITAQSWSEGSIMAALASGRAAQNTRLKLSVLHRFSIRSRSGQVTPSMLCLDSQRHVCQVNLHSQDNQNKLETLLKESNTNTFYLEKLAICKRVSIDRARGLRSLLSTLHPESSDQQLLYVALLFSDQWSAQMIHAPTWPLCQPKVLTLQEQVEDEESRVSGRLCVIALRGDQLYVWDRKMDSYYKVFITSSAALPRFSARDNLNIQLLLASHGELIIDKYSNVEVVEKESPSSQFSIPHLAIEASKGDLVLLDGFISKVNSDVYLRWAGDCGHALLKLQGTGLFYCSDCSRTVTSCHQRLALEVGIVVSDVSAPIRLKVKNETAQMLILGNPGEVSSNKCYNMIGAIGSNLKCVTLVLEVLKNPFGDILEFYLEEL